MTITTNDTREEFTATAGQTVFNYTFKIFSATDLTVYITPTGQVANDATDITTAFVVDAGTIGNPAGGFITLDVGATLNDLVTIVSNIASNRTTDYQNNGDFLPDTVNDDFDRVVSLGKQVEALANRTLQFQESQQGVSALTLPPPKADNVLIWNAGLTGFDNDDGSGLLGVGASATAAAASAAAAATSETNAASSETAASTSETNAATSETNAATSASNAGTSETNAASSASAASSSASAASTSASNASTSETNAASSASAASTSETNAGTSETNAGISETNAATSASNAATSETNAATSETNAAASAATASISVVPTGNAAGTVDVITATLTPTLASLLDRQKVRVRAAGANTSTTPTFNPDGLGAETIVKLDGIALAIGDIAGADHELELVRNGATGEWHLVNPASEVESIVLAASDETTDLTTGVAKLTFRMPYAFTLTDVRASVTTAPTGSVLTVDINETGTTILSTKITIDATEKTSTTAATPPVISDASLADDAEITIDIDQVGSTIAGTGLKVTLIGTRT